MMKQKTSASLVKKIMTEFARLTRLSPANNMPRRYLWTDAFAVCNFLGLYQETVKEHDLRVRMNALKHYEALKEVIDKFWLQGGNQEAESWIAHRDINMVMLATSLSPDGYLRL